VPAHLLGRLRERCCEGAGVVLGLGEASEAQLLGLGLDRGLAGGGGEGGGGG
jgi:hypothetical protein